MKWGGLFASAGAMALVCVAHAAEAQAQRVDPLAAKFGAREAIHAIGLSPEGKQAVVVANLQTGGEAALIISLADGSSTPILAAKGRSERIGTCQFITEQRLVCEAIKIEGTGDSLQFVSRLIALSSDGKSSKMLTARSSPNSYFQARQGGDIIDYNVPDNPEAVLITRYFPPEVRTGTLASSIKAGLGVEQVDVVTLQRRRIEPPKDNAGFYGTDGQGHVRLMETETASETGYTRDRETYLYRPIDGGWTPLSTITVDARLEHGFQPIAVDSRENVAFGLDANGNFTALYKQALDGSGKRTLVLGRKDADVDGLIRIGRSRRIVGASYVTDRREAEYFDPQVKQLVGSLTRVLGGNRQVAILDASTDENKLLLVAASDTEPERYYVFDKQTRQLAELMPDRAELADVKMGQVRSLTYPAADGTMIPAYLTLPPGSDGKNLPAIVMPHGGPQSRDEWGFDWLSEFYVAHGFAVLRPNYRGSAGMGAAWFKDNGWQSWATAIGDVNSAGRWLVDQHIAAPGKLAIVGWSYGGYAALQSQVLDPDLFKAVVAIAPVTDLDRLREEFRPFTNFQVMNTFIGTGPHIAAGSPARHADRFKAPVLMFHGSTDNNVNIAESRLMEARLKEAGKNVRLVEFPGLDHQLDDAAARTQVLGESEAFLARTLGLGTG